MHVSHETPEQTELLCPQTTNTPVPTSRLRCVASQPTKPLLSSPGGK